MKKIPLIILLSFVICSCKKEPVDNMVVIDKDNVTTVDNTKMDSIHLANLRLDSICSYYQNNSPENLDDIAGKYVGVISVHANNQIDDLWNRRYDSLHLEDFEFELKKHPIYDSCNVNQEVKYDLTFKGKNYRFHFYDWRVKDDDFRIIKFSYDSDNVYTYQSLCAKATAQDCGSGYAITDSLIYDDINESIQIKLDLKEYSKPYVLYSEQIVIEAKKQ